MSEIKVRHLILGEQLPDALRTGFEVGQCDPNWIWLAEREGKLQAILIAAPAHILVILLRLAAVEDAPARAVYELLTNAFSEMHSRGYKGYVVWLNPTRPNEQGILGLVRGSGGQQSEEVQVACYGRFDRSEMN